MVVFIYFKNSKFMVIKSNFFKSSSFLFLKNENEFENIRIPPPCLDLILYFVFLQIPKIRELSLIRSNMYILK